MYYDGCCLFHYLLVKLVIAGITFLFQLPKPGNFTDTTFEETYNSTPFVDADGHMFYLPAFFISSKKSIFLLNLKMGNKDGE